MFCVKCGTELPDVAAFCIHCGAPRFPVPDSSDVPSLTASDTDELQSASTPPTADPDAEARTLPPPKRLPFSWRSGRMRRIKWFLITQGTFVLGFGALCGYGGAQPLPFLRAYIDKVQDATFNGEDLKKYVSKDLQNGGFSEELHDWFLVHKIGPQMVKDITYGSMDISDSGRAVSKIVIEFTNDERMVLPVTLNKQERGWIIESIDPAKAILHLHMAEGCEKRGDWDADAEESRLAVVLNPGSADGHFALAYALNEAARGDSKGDRKGLDNTVVSEINIAERLPPNAATIYAPTIRNECSVGTISVAVLFEDTGKHWITQGWWSLEPSKEQNPFSTTNPIFYYYAESQSMVWKDSSSEKPALADVVSNPFFYYYGEKLSQSRPVPMREAKMDRRDFVLRLTCPSLENGLGYRP